MLWRHNLTFERNERGQATTYHRHHNYVYKQYNNFNIIIILWNNKHIFMKSRTICKISFCEKALCFKEVVLFMIWCFFKWQFNTKTLLPFFCFATDFSLIWAKHSISSLYFGKINVYLWKVEQFAKFRFVRRPFVSKKLCYLWFVFLALVETTHYNRFVCFILSTHLDLGNAQVTLQYTQFVCKSVWD